MAGNRSVFVSPDYAVDEFPTLYNLPPELAGDAQELQQLQMTVNKTADQITRMNNLTSELANYLINPETFNHFTDCIVNLESNWLNIYNEFTTYINQAQANIDTYINNKENEMTTFVNQKQIEITQYSDTIKQEIIDFVNQNKTDVTTFVNNKETEMTNIKDSYIALVNQKSNELQDLNTKTDTYWQKWNASSAGQTDYNIFDPSAENPLPDSAVLNFDISRIELTINGTRQTPYDDYDRKQDSNGQYSIITLKGNASSLVNVGTEVFMFFYKNVGSLYNKHASTHQAGGRDQIVVSEPMLDDNLTNKINNQIYIGDTAPTNSFVGQVWFAPI